ncbi:MAG: type II toxin-antitoxin system VapC family toxin [Coriobacteriales bacterium]|jgi:PIN domain nuclease of toxin-antitoxin system|nr:type II toxin-antitoxin system VapC family toxin [Coriobacteriales bacterium]
MKCLLDTCSLLWLLSDSKKLSSKAVEVIKDRRIEVYASTISFWELSLKHGIGKLALENYEIEEIDAILLEDLAIGIIGLNEQESLSYFRLPSAKDHRDPFERMLAWQAIKRDMALVSSDPAFEQYRRCGLRIIW